MDDTATKQDADNAFLDTVADSEFHLIHPAKVEYSDLYASPSSTETQVAQTQVSTGRMIVSANNLRLGGQSNFLLTASSLLGGFVLNASIVIDDKQAVPIGWLFMAIRELQVSFSPSQVQNLTISGQSLFDYSMLSAPTKDEREQVLLAAGRYQSGPSSGTVVAKASIPLSFILANNSVMNGFPIDLATINTMTLTVVWNPATYFVQDPTDGTTWVSANEPTELNDCYISVTTVDIVNPDFSIKAALRKDPNSIYPIPVKYITSEEFTIPSYTPGSLISRQVQGFQDGITTDLIVTLKPISQQYSELYYKYPAGVDLESLSLEYAGQVLQKYSSNSEYKAQCIQKWGDALNFNYQYSMSGNTNIAVYGGTETSKFDNGVLARLASPSLYDVPFAYRPRRVISGNRTENLVGYSGKSLNLKMSSATSRYIDIVRPIIQTVGTDDIATWDIQKFAQEDLPTGDYVLNLTYINEGVLTVDSNGLIKLVTS